MKFARVRTSRGIIPTIVEGEKIFDLSGICRDIDRSFLVSDGVENVRAASRKQLPVIRHYDGFAPPIADPGKVVCVGLNYFEHAREANLPVPTEPVLFLKPTTALSGAADPILYPPGATKLDWEVELALIVSKPGRHIREEDAARHIAGFCVLNDISERAYQFERGGQWMKGKSYDSFAPLGPYLVTPDEVGDWQNLTLMLTVDGEVMQRGSTADMIFPVTDLIAYISRFMTLEAGDVITTGTPPGVGLGHVPPRFLCLGSTVVAEIDGLGAQKQTVVQDRGPVQEPSQSAGARTRDLGTR